MTYQFDHIVHFVGYPEKAAEVLQSLGLHAVQGGRHETFGTYNALSYFGLSYIELMGVFDQNLLESQDNHPYSLQESLLENNYENGAVRIAVRSKDLQADAERFRKLGLEVIGPMDLSRKRPDGTVLSWKLLFIGKNEVNPKLPFLIEWDDSDEERLKNLKEQNTIAPHPIGEISLTSVGYAVKNIDASINDWSTYLQLEKGASFIDESLQAEAQVLHLKGGNVIFYEPVGDGKAKEFLEKNGEKPFLIEFKNKKEEKDIEVFGTIYRFTK